MPLRVLHVDLDDEAVMEQVATYLSDLAWSSVDGRLCAEVYVDESDVVCAAVDVACRIQTRLPGARVDQVDDELVGIPDIAIRTKLNRETIRSWTNASRGPGNFPMPVGSLGGGERGSTKVWRWREVNEWLGKNFSLGDSFQCPSQAEVFQINLQLSRLDFVPHSAVQHGPPMFNTLNVNTTVSLPGEMRVVVTIPEMDMFGVAVQDAQNVTIGSA